MDLAERINASSLQTRMKRLFTEGFTALDIPETSFYPEVIECLLRCGYCFISILGSVGGIQDFVCIKQSKGFVKGRTHR